MCLNVCVGCLSCEQLRQADKCVFLNLHVFDGFGLIFPLACFSLFFDCICFISSVWCLKESAVDRVLSSSLSHKALGLAATNLSSVHFTFPSIPQTHAFMHASTHNQTHIGTQGQVQACICAHPPRHAHLFLMLVSLHILAG